MWFANIQRETEENVRFSNFIINDQQFMYCSTVNSQTVILFCNHNFYFQFPRFSFCIFLNINQCQQMFNTFVSLNKSNSCSSFINDKKHRRQLWSVEFNNFLKPGESNIFAVVGGPRISIYQTMPNGEIKLNSVC